MKKRAFSTPHQQRLYDLFTSKPPSCAQTKLEQAFFKGLKEKKMRADKKSLETAAYYAGKDSRKLGVNRSVS